MICISKSKSDFAGSSAALNCLSGSSLRHSSALVSRCSHRVAVQVGVNLALDFLSCPVAVIRVQPDLKDIVHISILCGGDGSCGDLQGAFKSGRVYVPCYTLVRQAGTGHANCWTCTCAHMIVHAGGQTWLHLAGQLDSTVTSLQSIALEQCGLTSRGIAFSAIMMSPRRPRLSLQFTLTYRQDSPCSTTTPELTGAPSGAYTTSM